MSATPVLVKDEPQTQPVGGMQQVIDAVNDFMREKASGCLEIHFSHGGIAKVFANHTKTYR